MVRRLSSIFLTSALDYNWNVERDLGRNDTAHRPYGEFRK